MFNYKRGRIPIYLSIYLYIYIHTLQYTSVTLHYILWNTTMRLHVHFYCFLVPSFWCLPPWTLPPHLQGGHLPVCSAPGAPATLEDPPTPRKPRQRRRRRAPVEKAGFQPLQYDHPVGEHGKTLWNPMVYRIIVLFLKIHGGFGACQPYRKWANFQSIEIGKGLGKGNS